jgi:hypothetical protein
MVRILRQHRLEACATPITLKRNMEESGVWSVSRPYRQGDKNQAR